MDKIYNLSHLSKIVEEGWRMLFGSGTYLCKAEVLHVKVRKRQVYIDLVEYNERGDIISKVTSILWSLGDRYGFLRSTGMAEKDVVGTEVLIRASLSFHHQRGFSLSIQEISSEFTRGVLSKQVEKTISLLKKEGVFKKNTLLSIDSFPVHLCVISSASSEGLTDFTTVINEHPYPITYELKEASIHGNAAKESVLLVFTKLLLTGDRKKYQAVVIVRGGGGKEGFLWQNDESLSRCICTFPVPVVVAVGHTTDLTILDQVVFQSCKTPTDAAYFFVDYAKSLDERVDLYFSQIERKVDSLLQQKTILCDQLMSTIITRIDNRVSVLNASLENWHQIVLLSGPERVLERGFSYLLDNNGVCLRPEGDLLSGYTYTLVHNSGSYEVTVVSKNGT